MADVAVCRHERVPCWCVLPKGHHGPHYCDGHGGLKWPNEADLSPCTSTEVATLGVLDGPVRVRCGLLEAHPGPHQFVLWWTDSDPSHNAASRTATPANSQPNKNANGEDR